VARRAAQQGARQTTESAARGARRTTDPGARGAARAAEHWERREREDQARRYGMSAMVR